MIKIAIFASGRGSNFNAIAKAVKSGLIKARLALLVCDNPEALVIRKAERMGIKVALVQRKDFTSKKDFETRIIAHLKAQDIGLIVLAGFMRILSARFVGKYKNRIINIHPSVLPSFKGTEVIRDAYDYGIKITGVTVHFVDQEMDHGPIILQAPVMIDESDTLVSLEEKIHKQEHKLYPEAIKLFIEGRLKIKGRKVKILTR